MGKVAFVTGAGSGIGAATARALAAEGAYVALVDLRAPTTLAAELGPQALALAGDVTRESDMEAAVQATLQRFGRIDICFANAGIAAAAPTTIRQTTVEEFERIIEVDLMGVWRTVRSCLPHIVEAEGHVLITASIYAFFNGVVNAPYAMSKAAVESFGRSLRGELAGTGATAGVLYPGWIATPIIEASHQQGTPADELVRLANPGPLGDTITPERLAEDIIAGIKSRRARIVSPRRWLPLMIARGPFAMAMDAVLDRHRRAQRLIRQIEGGMSKV